MKEDMIQLMLYLSRTVSLSEVREDTSNIIYILLSLVEVITITDVVAITKGSATVRYDTGAKFDLCTFG